AVAAALGPRRAAAVRWAALAATLITLALVAAFTIEFASHPRGAPDGGTYFAPVMTTERDILPLQIANQPDKPTAIRFFVGIDGLNVWLVALTAVLMVPSVLV